MESKIFQGWMRKINHHTSIYTIHIMEDNSMRITTKLQIPCWWWAWCAHLWSWFRCINLGFFSFSHEWKQPQKGFFRDWRLYFIDVIPLFSFVSNFFYHISHVNGIVWMWIGNWNLCEYSMFKWCTCIHKIFRNNRNTNAVAFAMLLISSHCILVSARRKGENACI